MLFATALRLAKFVKPTSPTRENMCLAIPGKLLEIIDDGHGVRMGRANFGGIVKQVCLEYTPEVVDGRLRARPCRFRLSKVDEDEAARTYKLLEEMEQLGELERPS